MKKQQLSLHVIGNEALKEEEYHKKYTLFTEKIYLHYTRLLIQLFIYNIGKRIALRVAC